MQTAAILKLYGPILVFVTLITYAVAVKTSKRRTTLPLQVMGIVLVHLPLSGRSAKRIVLIALAFLSLSAYLTYNYTQFFPSHFKMDVFFDDVGLAASLKDFSDAELRELGVPADFQKYQHVYFVDLDKELRRLLDVDSFFTVRDGILHSEGETSLHIERIGGIQNYHIVEAEGSVTHVLEQAKAPPLSFKTYFQKLNSGADFLRPTLVDIYIHHQLILCPMFKQIVAEQIRSDGVVFDHVLYGATKVRFFPLPSYGRTVYLFKYDEVGKIPIAYAEYREQR